MSGGDVLRVWIEGLELAAGEAETALVESPPQLEEQDGVNAEEIQRVRQRFPMPMVVPGTPGGVFRI